MNWKNIINDEIYEKDLCCISGPVIFGLDEWEYGLANCYALLRYNDERQYLINPMKLRQQLPLEELDTCSKEEALEVCDFYAEILGYGDGEVSVYAWTLEYLEDSAVKEYAPGGYFGAPDESYQAVSEKQAQEGKGSSLEKRSIYERGIPWEKKHEALYVIYRPCLHGKLMYSENQTLRMIYVPYYGKVVFMEGHKVYTVKEVLRQEELISQEEAVGLAMTRRNIKEQADFRVKEISLVYTEYSEVEGEFRKKLAYPTWKIDYTSGEQDVIQETILINAVNGFESYTE